MDDQHFDKSIRSKLENYEDTDFDPTALADLRYRNGGNYRCCPGMYATVRSFWWYLPYYCSHSSMCSGKYILMKNVISRF